MPSNTARSQARTLLALAFVGLLAGRLAAEPAQTALSPEDQAKLDALVAAYPEALSGHDDKVLRWRDGTSLPVSDGEPHKSFDELLRHASILDQLRLPYPQGPLAKPPAVDADPGRFRNRAFFVKMYGDCQKGEVTKQLVALTWLPKSFGKTILITSANGAAKHLREISDEIDALPDTIKRAAFPIAGTYNCRAVADTGQPSGHGYGIAIDLNLTYSDYWLWKPHAGTIAYHNRMPPEIVAIFEKHGFIWGGKWYHFDTMHFEYRPELLPRGGE